MDDWRRDADSPKDEFEEIARKKSTCAFTGHRENKLPWQGNETDPRCLRLKQRIFDAVQAVYTSGARYFLSGMANGCDMYFCDAVLQLREERPEISLEAVVPYPGQADAWPSRLRTRYDRLLGECNLLTVISPQYTRACMMRRNYYMVDAAAFLIAAYQGSPGGTRSTILYAMRQGLNIIQLDIDAGDPSPGLSDPTGSRQKE